MLFIHWLVPPNKSAVLERVAHKILYLILEPDVSDGVGNLMFRGYFCTSFIYLGSLLVLLLALHLMLGFLHSIVWIIQPVFSLKTWKILALILVFRSAWLIS